MKLSTEGHIIVSTAQQEKGWTDDSGKYEWILAASKIIDPSEKWKKNSQYNASGCSFDTLEKFLKLGSIQPKAFQAFCQAVGVNSEQVCEQETHVFKVETSETAITKSNEPSFYQTQPDEVWVGRDNQRGYLRKKLLNECRLLLIVGISGVGKSSLAQKLIKSLEVESGNYQEKQAETFIYLTSFEFDRINVSAISFAEIAEKLLLQWGEHVAPNDKMPENLENLIKRFIKYWQQRRYILLLDAIENIIQTEEKTGYNNFIDSAWLKFFMAVLELPNCLSRLILTSRQLPSEFNNFSKQSYHLCLLKGLEEVEALELFGKANVNISLVSRNLPFLKRIAKVYGGHPLAIWLIAKEIISSFNNDAEAYWEYYSENLEDIELNQLNPEILSEQDEYRLYLNNNLEKRVRNKIYQIFERLEKEFYDAYKLIIIGSAYRRFVPRNYWYEGMYGFGHNSKQVQRALKVLFERYLVEKDRYMGRQEIIGLHNLIRSVALECAKKIKVRIPRNVYEQMRQAIDKQIRN